MQRYDIPLSLIINLDETGIQMIPRHTRTLAPKGSKQVPGTAKKSLAQITKVTAVTAAGVLLPYQLIFGGKTDLVHPDILPSTGSIYSHTASHFTIGATQLQMVTEVIIPFVESERQRSGLDRQALLIWDGHSTHTDDAVLEKLNSHRIFSRVLPPNCTSKYQPLDVLFNGMEKRYLVDHFADWHAKSFAAALERDPDVLDVLPTKSSSKRRLIAALIRAVHEMMSTKQHLITTAWRKSTLLDDLPDGDDSEWEQIGLDSTISDVLSEVMQTKFSDSEPEQDDEADQEDETLVDPGDAERTSPQLNLLHDDQEDTDGSYSDDEEASSVVDNGFDSSDDEFSALKPLRKQRTLPIPDDISVETSQMVRIGKHHDGEHIELEYMTSHQPTPYHIVEMMKKQKTTLKNCKILSVTKIGPQKLIMKVNGVDRTTFLDGANSFTWLPEQEITASPTQ